MPNPNGPYLTTVALCQAVHKDAGGILSLVRLFGNIDAREPHPDDPSRMHAIATKLTLVVGLTAGTARGRGTVTLRIEMPSGLRLPDMSFPVHFHAPELGETLEFPIDFEMDQEGVYWFDVLYEGSLLTRVPLRVRYRPAPRVAP